MPTGSSQFHGDAVTARKLQRWLIALQADHISFPAEKGLGYLVLPQSMLEHRSNQKSWGALRTQKDRREMPTGPSVQKGRGLHGTNIQTLFLRKMLNAPFTSTL